LLIVFQPELRAALEQLGQKKIISSFGLFDDTKDKNERFSNDTIDSIVTATYALAKTKTGALIVIEKDVLLAECERTGIALDSKISSQLLINIFEHNTPLHDGAVLVRGDRIISATCYLPLSDNTNLSKELGTRHRAGIGISEVSDSLTIIVSEETGKVSVTSSGKITRNVTVDSLRKRLKSIQRNTTEVKKAKSLKGWHKNERKNNK
jgi:diadenylate cyclase